MLDNKNRKSDTLSMSPKQVIAHFGGIPAAAAALGIKAPTIYDWIEVDQVPESRQYQIEMATSGVIKADKPALRTTAKTETTQEAA